MTQANFKFISDAAGGDQFTVVSFSGHEAISTLYQYQIEIRTPLSAVISLDDVLDSPARFITDLDDKEYPVHGILSNFEELQTTQDYVHFKAVLVPRLWGLSIYKTNEIYTQEKTVDLIIETVLENAGLVGGTDYDLTGLAKNNLLSRNYVCQFGESDFDFISRLMENEGIFYYFDHNSGDAEKIIFINDMNYEEISRPALTFDVTPSTSQLHDCIDAWSCRKQRLAAGVTVRDFNPEQPSLDIADTTTIDPMSRGTDYYYGENIQDADEATYLSEIRAEQRLCNKTRYYGEGSVTRLQPGYLFQMDMHPNDNYNGVEYLAVEVNHEGQHLDIQIASESTQTQPQYRNSFVAIEAAEQFRPSRVTPKPRFYGTMTAFIYAEAATTKAEIDEYGRYRVHLPFDRADGTLLSTDPNRKASTWIRMAQPYVGQEQGMYYPLTGGTEVLLTFINGDPDQPIISGAVPNASQPSLLTSATNFQRTVTSMPSQTVTGNTHRVSRNSAYLANSDEIPSAPSPSGINSGANFTSLSAAALEPSTVEQTYINGTVKAQDLSDEGQYKSDDDLGALGFKSMIPPWTLSTGAAAEWSDASPAYDPLLIKFKIYKGDFTTVDLEVDDENLNADGEGTVSDDSSTTDFDESDKVSTERGGGDSYVYANGRTFAYPQHERVYFIGTFHEDFHVKDNFMVEGESWTGVKEQFNFPAPGEDFPVVAGVKLRGEEDSDTDVNPKGIRGVSEDKRWGDQMNYAWGRVFNWGGGKEMGTGKAGGEYNYGNAYTENLLALTGGTSSDENFPHKPSHDWNFKPENTPQVMNSAAAMIAGYILRTVTLDIVGDITSGVLKGVDAISKDALTHTWSLNPDYTAAEKTFGHKYEYHMGLSVGIHEGNSVEKTWGDKQEFFAGSTESVTMGDSFSTTLGTSSEYTAGTKWDFTLGVTNSYMIGGVMEWVLAGKLQMELSITTGINAAKDEAYEVFKEEVTAKSNKTAIDDLETTLNKKITGLSRDIRLLNLTVTAGTAYVIKAGTIIDLNAPTVNAMGGLVKIG